MSSVPSATIIGGASERHERHASDFYETPVEAPVALFRHLPHWRDRTTWECACGNGLLVQGLEKVVRRPVIATDIRVTMLSLTPVDFLQAKHLPLGVEQIVTNPPFDLAAEFIRKCRSLRVPFALLLKGSFWHAAERRALFSETGPAKVLPLGWRPAMAPERGKSPTMEFLWTVWEAVPVERCEYYPLVKP